MNPELYKLPLSHVYGRVGNHVADHEGNKVASFHTHEQAADFIAEINKHAPKQPKRPKECWAIWNKRFGRLYCGEKEESPLFLNPGDAERFLAESTRPSELEIVRFDSLPIGEP